MLQPESSAHHPIGFRRDYAGWAHGHDIPVAFDDLIGLAHKVRPAPIPVEDMMPGADGTILVSKSFFCKLIDLAAISQDFKAYP